MENYKLFLFQQKRLFSTREFAAEGDEAALALAEALRAGRDAELWGAARRVHYWRGAGA